MIKKKETILIIESNSKVADKISDSIQSGGYLVNTITSGLEAVKSIKKLEPNLIILDLAVEGVDAYEILKQKSEDKDITKIPVILLSSQGLPIAMAKVPEGAITEIVFSTDFEAKDFLTKINKIFGYKDEEDKDKEINKKSVVWVEDDKLLGSILEKKFSTSGLNLFHAKNGDEMLAYLVDHVPDVMVIDLLLPGLGGFEILQQIRMDKRFKNVPVMILSNLSKPSDIEKAKILGAKKFVIKAATSLDDIVKDVKSMV